MAWDPGNGMILQLHLTQFERPKDVNLDPIPVAKRSQDFPKRTPPPKVDDLHISIVVSPPPAHSQVDGDRPDRPETKVEPSQHYEWPWCSCWAPKQASGMPGVW